MRMPEPGETAPEFWDRLYGERDRIWSGRVNPRLAEIAADLPPGRALDLGCGEGGDSMWLAEHGWRVVATDISPVALERAAADATQRGVADRIEFFCTDLTESVPDGPFDLVSAQFLQSPMEMDRTVPLRAAAEAITTGGHLLVVDHGSAPSWAGHHDFHFPGVEEVFDSLHLDSATWQRVRAEAVEREVTGPDSQVETIADNVILVRRLK